MIELRLVDALPAAALEHVLHTRFWRTIRSYDANTATVIEFVTYGRLATLAIREQFLRSHRISPTRKRAQL